MSKKGGAVCVILFCCMSIFMQAGSNQNQCITISKRGHHCFPRKPSPRETLLGGLWRDFVDLNKYALFSVDTFKVVTTTFPFYILTRMFDEDLQRNFHRSCCHRDINQAPHWCRSFSRYGLGIPMTTLGLMALLGTNEEFRTTGRIFLLGMPLVVWGKDIIKKFNFDANRRPWCDRFSCKERALGGFPSGHMAEIAYMTVLYGLRYGVKAAAPLGAFGFFLGATFFNCNRHYVSQLVAGAGLGTLFALAADKVIDIRLEKKYKSRFACAYDTDMCGQPAIKVSCTF